MAPHNAGPCISALPHPVLKGPAPGLPWFFLFCFANYEWVGWRYNLAYRRNLYANFRPPGGFVVWIGFDLRG